MTPAPPPAPSSNAGASVKQQRAARRAQKLEEYHKAQKRSALRRKLWIIGGSVAAIAVVTIVVLSVVLTPQKKGAAFTPGGDGGAITGVETFKNEAGHVQTSVTYPQIPPAGGEHNPIWLNCGVYSEMVPNENAVHALEHGAIWVTYDPTISKEELEKLRKQLPSTFVVLSPFDGLSSPIVLSAWNAQLKLDSASDKRIPTFFEEYWQGGNAPELGSPCTGGIDGAGKVS